MAQHKDVALPIRRYTRIDYAALRFFLQLGQVDEAFRLYSDADLFERGIQSNDDLRKWLTHLRDSLVDRARDTNPLVSQILERAKGSARWGRQAIDFIVKAGEQGQVKPSSADRLSLWFKPVATKSLNAEGIITVAQLKRTIEVRGPGWFRPIPRLGQHKAHAFERWLQKHEATLGRLNLAPAQKVEGLVVLDGRTKEFTPLERVQSIATGLDGVEGKNRGVAGCLISASNDLEAVQAYLYKFKDRPQTERSYRKEIERFLLWCVHERRIPLSSVLTEECEAYKDFLGNLPERWLGPRQPRHSRLWKPFASQLEPDSQKYAVQILKSFFAWLVNVRYLGGNPWITVAPPKVTRKVVELGIEKALPQDLWETLAGRDGLLNMVCEARHSLEGYGQKTKAGIPQGPQYRLARAAILLMGRTGLRRAEAAQATRNKLRQEASDDSPIPLWRLEVIGKGNKARYAYLGQNVIEAIRAHWQDRGHQFEDAQSTMALLSPVSIPGTPASLKKHLQGSSLKGSGYSPDGLYQVVKSTLLRMANDTQLPLTDQARALLKDCAPHALRHTFAMHALKKKMALEELRELLGHASLQTTSIYVKAEQSPLKAAMRNLLQDE